MFSHLTALVIGMGIEYYLIEKKEMTLYQQFRASVSIGNKVVRIIKDKVLDLKEKRQKKEKIK